MGQAIQATLTGNKSVKIIERDVSQWKVTVVVRTSECADSAATLAAATSQKPAGITLTLVVTDGEIWNEAGGTWNSTGSLRWDDVGNPTTV
jgi:hypothetical protein